MGNAYPGHFTNRETIFKPENSKKKKDLKASMKKSQEN